MLTRPYDASSCLYLYIGQACWVACSPRLDFLYPTVTEPIELEVLLSIYLSAAHHLSHPPEPLFPLTVTLTRSSPLHYYSSPEATLGPLWT